MPELIIPIVIVAVILLILVVSGIKVVPQAKAYVKDCPGGHFSALKRYGSQCEGIVFLKYNPEY